MSEAIVPGGVGAGGAVGIGKTAAEAVAANTAKEVWKGSIVQSRVNLRNGDGSTASGLEYAWKKHGGDPDDLELPASEALGVFLSPLEISDAGFYLFYYPKDNDEECLVYSSDYGSTAKKTILKKGTVNSVLDKLPNQEAI